MLFRIILVCLLSGAARSEPPPAVPEHAAPPSIDEVANTLRRDKTWSIVLMQDSAHSITFRFGDVGRRIIELKWAGEDNASVGEVSRKVDSLYQGKSGDNSGLGNMKVRGMEGARSAQAYGEMRRTVDSLNRGRLKDARGHLTLMESASNGLPGSEGQDYSAAAKTLHRAHAMMASDEGLKRLIRAAERGDFREREALKAELRAYGKSLGADLNEFLEAGSAVWDAYGADEPALQGKGGDLAAALKELDAAEAMVQGGFRRSAYTAAFDRIRGLSRGLTKRERAILAARLKKHAAMWNKASADTLALAFLYSLSPDPKARGECQKLLDQARWKGAQAARSHNLFRQLSAVSP